MPTRLADRLLEGAHAQFVGREAQCRLFEEALASEELPFCVLHVYGPGGVGKTTLMRELLYRCSRKEIPAFYLDGRVVEPHPDAFLEALREAMGLPADATPSQALAAEPGRKVLLLDTYELQAPLERWLLQTFLPGLSDDVLVVFAGRHAPSPAWERDPGWRTLLRVMPLRNLSLDESRDYLTRVGVPAEQHDGVLQFTHGYPLALSLVGDTYAQRPGVEFESGADPETIKTLLDRFVMKVPSPAHRAALEACALVHYVTESLLAEMMALPDVRDLFAWLRGLSFIEAGPFGLFPHDVARDALSADLRWRNPEWYAELHDRARGYYNRRLSETRGRAQQRVLSDYMYLHRDNPVIKPFLDWHDTGSSVPTPATEADEPILREMVTRHEGEASGRLASYWLARQPEGVLVCRGVEQEPTGFLAMVALHETTEGDREADPAVAAACRYLKEHAPLRPGERATLFRFWLARDEHQAVSGTQSLLFLKMAQHYLTTPDLAFSFVPFVAPDFWAPFCDYGELERLPEADYEVGGQRYGVFGHDWRAVPPMQWLDHLAQKEVATTDEPVPASIQREPLIVLSEDAFYEAVRDALRAYVRPRKLRNNPLLASRVVADRLAPDADDAARIEALRTLLRETAEALQDAPRQEKAYRALDRAYFRPAPSQEQAAELLDLPYSTFRRHLKTGVEEVTAALWQGEVGA